MDKKTADTASIALARINRLIENEEIVIFSADEAASLKELAEIWRQIKATLTLGGTIGKGIKWLVMFVAAWAAIKAGILTWLVSEMQRAGR